MTPDEFKFWFMVGFQVVNTVISAGLWLYVRYGDRHKEIDRKFEELRRDMDTRLDHQEKNIAHLRGVTDRAPTHGDLNRIEEKINITANTLAAVNGRLQSVDDTLKLILNRITERGMK